jgi:hypothetical protein
MRRPLAQIVIYSRGGRCIPGCTMLKPLLLPYRRSLLISILVQVVILVAGKTAEDGGVLWHQAVYAVLLYWVMAIGIINAKRAQPSTLNLFVIRNGLLAMLLLVIGAAKLREYFA